MPTYDFRCPKCGVEYENFQKMSDRSRPKCPRCGTRGELLISGGAGLVFKGSGFYITDYKRAGTQQPSEGETSDSPKDKKKKKKDKSGDSSGTSSNSSTTSKSQGAES